MTPEQLHQIDQARRYADQDEYAVTRTHIRNLLAIIEGQLASVPAAWMVAAGDKWVTLDYAHAKECAEQAEARGFKDALRPLYMAAPVPAAIVPDLSLVESFKAQLIESVNPIFWPHIEAASAVIIERMKAAAPEAPKS